MQIIQGIVNNDDSENEEIRNVSDITNSGYEDCDNPWQSKGTNIEPSELCAHKFTINLSSLP